MATSIKEQEIRKMVRRAISSGGFHGVQLQHGRPNPANGDCAFEAIIYNNNDRKCFKNKFDMSIDHYRRIWTTDMANRTVNSPWNTVGYEEWFKGWKDMSNSGTYERGIFGDLMLQGIACGIKKILLIFITSLNSAPIYVVDPSEFNVKPDTDIPIILAYNMAHYESMEPCTDADNIAAVNLVKEYQEGRYEFTTNDLPYLFGIKGSNNATDDKSTVLQKQSKNNILATSSVQFKNFDDNSSDTLCYKLRGAKIEHCFVEIDGKIECPICKLLVKNIQLHLNKNFCINEIDYEHFQVCFNVYKKAKQQKMNKEKKDRWKKNNPELSKEKNKMYKKNIYNEKP